MAGLDKEAGGRPWIQSAEEDFFQVCFGHFDPDQSKAPAGITGVKDNLYGCWVTSNHLLIANISLVLNKRKMHFPAMYRILLS